MGMYIGRKSTYLIVLNCLLKASEIFKTFLMLTSKFPRTEEIVEDFAASGRIIPLPPEYMNVGLLG